MICGISSFHPKRFPHRDKTVWTNERRGSTPQSSRGLGNTCQNTTKCGPSSRNFNLFRKGTHKQIYKKTSTQLYQISTRALEQNLLHERKKTCTTVADKTSVRAMQRALETKIIATRNETGRHAHNNPNSYKGAFDKLAQDARVFLPGVIEYMNFTPSI